MAAKIRMHICSDLDWILRREPGFTELENIDVYFRKRPKNMQLLFLLLLLLLLLLLPHTPPAFLLLLLLIIIIFLRRGFYTLTAIVFTLAAKATTGAASTGAGYSLHLHVVAKNIEWKHQQQTAETAIRQAARPACRPLWTASVRLRNGVRCTKLMSQPLHFFCYK